MGGDRFQFGRGRSGRVYVGHRQRQMRDLRASDYQEVKLKGTGTADVERDMSSELRAVAAQLVDRLVPCEGCEHDMTDTKEAQLARQVLADQCKARGWLPPDVHFLCEASDPCGCRCALHHRQEKR